MRVCLVLLALLASACSDDTLGTQGSCASGGTINECPDFPHTPQGACEKLVQCGLIERDAGEGGGFDWGECVNEIQRRYDDGLADFVIACTLASSCDELANGYCFRFGEN
jgi:hypothetical protein